MEGDRRISVKRGQDLVPLLPHAKEETSHAQPLKGVLLETHRVVPSEIPEHEHPDLCLHLQHTGSERFEWWSEGRHAVEATHPGSLILIPPGTRDRLRWAGASERTILSIAPGTLEELARELGAARSPEFAVKWSLDDPALRRIVTGMARDARDRWPLGTLYSDLVSLGLKKHLLRAQSVDGLLLPPLTGGLTLPVLRRAMEFMNAALAGDVRLESIAQALGMSASHFAHQFRCSTGQTPYQYVLDQRMARAKELLKTTRLAVQFIAAQVGFGSSANFVRAFRQRVGVTPETWRRNA